MVKHSMTIITHILMFVSESSVPAILVFTGCAPFDVLVCWASAEFVKQKMRKGPFPKYPGRRIQ